MGLIPWALAGVGLCALHHVLLTRLVAGLDPVLTPRHVIVRVLSGYVVRYLSLMMLLVLAVRQSAGAGIAAAVAFVLTRWVWALRGVSR